MTFKFPPKEILEKALNMLSEEDIKGLRKQYLCSKKETTKYWSKNRRGNYNGFLY